MESEDLMTRRTALTLATFVLLVSGSGLSRAGATPPLLQATKRAGYVVEGCQYCHTFDTTHMIAEARRAGISNMDCGACHGARLPRSGDALYNDRGRWLIAQKRLRRAPKVDVAWLRAYTPPSPPASPK
jgi:hypothetical protein